MIKVLLFSLLFVGVVSVSSVKEGRALIALKSSFSDRANLLRDWNETQNANLCSWRGVSCAPSTYTVVSIRLSGMHLGGVISPLLGALKKLESLDLSNNNLSGSIPSTVGDLEHLLILNASFNSLSGVLPVELGQLHNINTLILNNNKIQGRIPDQLTKCSSLVNLNISYNNLSGTIPSTNHFSHFASASFLGNPFLCGNFVGSICVPEPKSGAFTKANVVSMVLGFFGFITLICIAIVCVICMPKQKQVARASPKQTIGPGIRKLVILHHNLHQTIPELMTVTENLSEKYITKHGYSSTIYKCTPRDSKSSSIAIKRMQLQNFLEFENELKTIGIVRHKNIVSLQGYASSSSDTFLFYEYMENGSLWDLLHGAGNNVKLDWETRLGIAVGAAQGLEYLHHDCIPRIIHRNIKSSNILFDEDFNACLSGFKRATQVYGSMGYLDPEYGDGRRLSEKTDVFSYGIVLLELLTRKKAMDIKIVSDSVIQAVDEEVLGTCADVEHITKTFQLALLCTNRNPWKRPSMRVVSRLLTSLVRIS